MFNLFSKYPFSIIWFLDHLDWLLKVCNEYIAYICNNLLKLFFWAAWWKENFLNESICVTQLTFPLVTLHLWSTQWGWPFGKCGWSEPTMQGSLMFKINTGPVTLQRYLVDMNWSILIISILSNIQCILSNYQLHGFLIGTGDFLELLVWYKVAYLVLQVRGRPVAKCDPLLVRAIQHDPWSRSMGDPTLNKGEHD